MPVYMIRSGAKAWPEADNATLRRLWDDGLTATAIASQMGRTKGQVMGRAHRLLLAPRGLCAAKLWPPEEVARFCALWAKRLTPPEIAQQMHRSLNQIFCKARRLQLARHPELGSKRSNVQPLLKRIAPVPVVAPPPPLAAPRAVIAAPAVVIHPPALRHTRTCQFIAGTGRPWTKCGKPVSSLGNPYCATCGKGLRIPIRRRAGADDAA